MEMEKWDLSTPSWEWGRLPIYTQEARSMMSLEVETKPLKACKLGSKVNAWKTKAEIRHHGPLPSFFL